MEPFKIFTPAGILGYGYDLWEFWHTVEEEKPAAIILDGGSTDPGPYMLGTGKTICSRASYERDLKPMLHVCSQYGIKLLVGSAGGAGTNAQVDWLVDVIAGLSKEKGYSFNVSTIKFNEDRDTMIAKVQAGEVYSCSSSPPLEAKDVQNAKSIVAQMGAEPWIKALESDPDIIISGRSYDPSPFIAYSMYRGVQVDPAWHMGKIMECGGLCAVPKGRSMMAVMYQDCFDLVPTNPNERCTPLSVAAHTFYEKTRPDQLPGPGGVLHLENATYEQLSDGKSVRVRGSKFVPTPRYQIKLEGVQEIGFRTIFIGGFRDPILIRQIDSFLDIVRSMTEEAFPALNEQDGPKLVFHVYGKDAVMGPLEPAQVTTHELGVLGEVLAQSQEEADAIAAYARVTCLHIPYDGQVATGGNLASPLTPLETSLGPVYKFTIYHVMDIDDPVSWFPIEKLVVGSRKDQTNGHTNGTNGVNGHGLKPPAARKQPPKKNVPAGPTTIAELAKVVRSKNAGPFEITLDILFDTAEDFKRVRESHALNREIIKSHYKVTDKDIITCMFFEPALGWKCTLKRPWPQGTFGERDTFGTQQHGPLLDIGIKGVAE
ncbi:hypothetical protein NA57DRAFT_62618 [Rhizodiscina lignyota]|uniref:DUF1446-domain-containing protein n=1 Tax=Rhizodiscina lignyota TaxID=1504668 RepID=A0A9P4IQZ0_9PEZI|nr:hypothetical protein NA57DRAFT_62618 [Rhizodiscina lignyota]